MTMGKVGRKGKWDEWLTEDGLLLIQGWARDGLTDEQIAKNMGIVSSTFYDWIKKFSEISRAIKEGRKPVDYLVENALLKSALGYDVEEETWERKFNRVTGEWEMICTKKQKKHIPPSYTAQIFWLKNRKPNEWKDRTDRKILLEDDADALSKAFEELVGNDDEGIQQETTTDSSLSEE